jgi:hypothetical protein
MAAGLGWLALDFDPQETLLETEKKRGEGILINKSCSHWRGPRKKAIGHCEGEARSNLCERLLRINRSQ